MKVWPIHPQISSSSAATRGFEYFRQQHWMAALSPRPAGSSAARCLNTDKRAFHKHT